MKIIELTRAFHPSIGGMEKFVADRLKIYDSLNYEYKVITTNHTEKILGEVDEKSYAQYLKSFTPFEITPKLTNAMNIDFDVLSVNQIGYYYSDFSIRNAFKKKKKIILTPHFFFHTDKHKFIKKLYTECILQNTLSKIDKMICFTEIEKEFWNQRFNFPKDKIEIIPHYFENNATQNGKKKSSVDYFLYVGRYEKNKRIDLLIEAFSKLESNFELYLTVNKNELSTNLSEIVHNHKIKLLGTVAEEEKQSLLSNCSALILPTDYEAFGIVNLEASFYKKPLLLSNLEVFKNVLNSDGILFFENNIQSIKNTLEKFITLNTENKRKMGEINFQHLSNFSFSKMKNDYKNLFEKLMFS